MEEKQWCRFVVQSVSLMICAIVICFLYSGGFLKNMEQKAQADQVTSQVNSQDTYFKTAVKSELQSARIVTGGAISARSSKYISIPKSLVTTGATLYISDDYINSKVILSIRGNTKQKISLDRLVRVNGEKEFCGNPKKSRYDFVKKIEIKSSRTSKGKYGIDISMTTKKLYEPVLYETEKAYYISFADPLKLYDRIIVVDAGHGGYDEGASARNKNYKEKNYNLLIVEELKRMLDATDIKVYYTRLDDRYISKADRVQLANKLNADMFISIHCNWTDSSSANGVETLFSVRENNNDKMSNVRFAKIMLNDICDVTKQKKRKVIKREGLYLLHHSDVPAIIIETGYLSNRSDFSYLKKSSGQRQMARGIYKGIFDVYGIQGK